MKTWTWSVAVVGALALGMAGGRMIAGGSRLTSDTFEGKTPKDAMTQMLQVAESQAGSGTWQLIAVGRVYYLSGDKKQGEAMFDKATSYKSGVSEWRRIGMIYAEAGEFDKAEAALQKAVAAKAEDTCLAEYGAMLNLNGKRAEAEEAFKKSIARDSNDVWNTVAMAGSFVGVRPD